MVFGNKAPEARVLRVIAVVAHHPVVVHRKGVVCGRHAVDADFFAVDFQRVTLVHLDDAAVERQIVRRERHRGSFLRYPDRAVVVLAPAGCAPLREDFVVGRADVAAHHRHVFELAQFLGRLLRDEHVVARAVARVFADAEILDGILRQRRGDLHQILVLGARHRFLGLAVDPYVAVAHLQRVARDGHAAFDVVFALVHRARDDRVAVVELPAPLFLAEGRLVAPHHVVVGHGLVLQQHRVAGREVEDHHVVAPHLAQSFEPVVGPLDDFGKRFAGLREWHGVVDERERDRRVGHLRSVGHLAYIEVVAHQQRLFHRRGGDDIHLEDEKVHQRSHHRGEYDGVHPFVGGLVRLAPFAQPFVAAAHVALEKFRDVEVEDQRQAQQQPEVARPYDEPQRVERGGQSEAHPLVAKYRSEFVHVHHNAASLLFISSGLPFRRLLCVRRGIRPPPRRPGPACGGS